jgi:hypothetical protein
MRFVTVASLVAGLCLTSIVGCSDGPKKYEVSGALTIDGRPPPDGASITFIPADGKNTTEGCTVMAGKYSAMVVPGSYKVEIRAPKIKAKPMVQPKDDYQTQGEIVEEMLPAKFNDTTELRFEVKAERNTKDWTLTTK